MSLKLFRAASLPALLLLAVPGCNTNVCDRIASSHTKLVSKAQPCGIDEGTFDTNACLGAYKNCTDADVDTVNAIWNCLDALPNCTTSDVGGWENQLQECQKTNLVTNQACSDATSLQGTP